MIATLDQLHAAFLRDFAPIQTEPVLATTPATPATEPAGAPAATVPPPHCQRIDFNAKGYHLDVRIAPDRVVEAARLLDQYWFAMDTITGVDWMAAGEMEVVYDFFHLTESLHVVLRTRVPRANPELPTISGVFPGANWNERETHEFFGIRFLGHPNLSPLLLPEDATYHPLRKDFVSAP